MEALRAYYRSRLGQRIEELDAAQDARRGGDPAAVGTLRAIAHQLKGTGRSYGFADVSELAAAVEEAPEDELEGRLAELLGALRRHAGEADP